ncbi:altronate dehydratase family protein [Clostridium sp. AL.422]|uniref:UxaA family hydrolase n=1 Tax=Clostridium TaxID=1485 RepID=UPI00293DC042|nr:MULTISPECIES: altronate dehydratase family protein [unclassified Clostridium]MDV4150459.1 altronate dehydratase family protein [Clostridium sp. AL.422]
MKDFIRINDNDNVVVALRNLKSGTKILIDESEIILSEDITAGHKISIYDIKEDENIIKYGFPIGHATENIPRGSWVHTHNVKTNLSDKIDYSYTPKETKISHLKGPKTFRGYRRKNGEVGIRNELWIVPTVGCVNGIADIIIREFKDNVDVVNVDAIEVFKHNYGCSQLGDDLDNTRKILADIVKHPNAGGVLVLGLGCENNTMNSFKSAVGKVDEDRVKFLICQNVEDEVEQGVSLLNEIYNSMKNDEREEVSISELKIGLKCGGSDGFSGITANPLLGKLSDYIISEGGTTVLTEVPEMFGAETILMNRAVNKETFEDIVDLINNFKDYFMQYNQPIYENPSPGNKEGGITTLEDKSLGCTQKGGRSKVTGVIKYGDRLQKNGLNLLQGPGNDLISTTALGAAGCQLVLFTTGRGTPFGSFIPTVKVASNSNIFNKKAKWIDFNAGKILEEKSIDEVAEEFIEYVINVANGEKTNNEKNKIHEISIFKSGVTE